MDNLTEIDCCPANANVRQAMPSVPSRDGNVWRRYRKSGTSRTYLKLALSISVACFLAGCGQDAPPKPVAEAKPAAPAVPDDVQGAADALLGKETTVLLFGDLAKDGKQQSLTLDHGKYIEVKWRGDVAMYRLLCGALNGSTITFAE